MNPIMRRHLAGDCTVLRNSDKTITFFYSSDNKKSYITTGHETGVNAEYIQGDYLTASAGGYRV